MANDSVIEWINQDEARALYVGGDVAHNFDHIRRVTQLARYLARAEGGDEAVVCAAALLHDVPVAAEVAEQNVAAARAGHHHAAAEFARTYLLARGMPLAQVENVTHCIAAHRYRDSSVMPQTLEARCLYDADKLDSMGAIGMVRAFAFAGAHGNRLWTQPVAAIEGESAPPQGGDYTPVHEYVYKLRRLQETLQTETGRAMGQARHACQTAFFTALDCEMAALDNLEVE